MNRLRLAPGLLVLGCLASLWPLYLYLNPRLQCIEAECWSNWVTESIRTEEQDCLKKAEAWLRSLPEPPLRQRWLRLRGGWCESALRMADYRLTLVFEDGRREQVSVWAGRPAPGGEGPDAWVLVRRNGYEVRGPAGPFQEFARSLRGP